MKVSENLIVRCLGFCSMIVVLLLSDVTSNFKQANKGTW